MPSPTSFAPASLLAAALLVLALAPLQADAHIALWHPSMYGFNGTATGRPANYNTNAAVNPLRETDKFTQDEWFHRFSDQPPLEGDVMELRPGTTQTFELGCNRAFTSYRNPNVEGPLNTYACGDEEPGPLHTVNEFGSEPDNQYLGGCALAIAYGSDIYDLSPTDFTVFSVNHTCVWTREIAFEVPKDMPACPAGGCHCAWLWSHTAGNLSPTGRTEGYASEMYLTTYKCEIVSPSANKALSKPSVPSECLSDPDSCTTGAKQGLFWSQASGNNLPAGLTAPPLYNAMYGFANGAQNDIFSEEAGIGEESDPVEDSAGARSVRGGSSVLAVGAASALLVVLLASA